MKNVEIDISQIIKQGGSSGKDTVDHPKSIGSGDAWILLCVKGVRVWKGTPTSCGLPRAS